MFTTSHIHWMSIHANLGGQEDNSIRLRLINCNCDVCVRKQNVVRNLWEVPNFYLGYLGIATINLQEYECSQCRIRNAGLAPAKLDHLPKDDANPDCPVVFSRGEKTMPRKLCRYQRITYYRQRKLWVCGVFHTHCQCTTDCVYCSVTNAAVYGICTEERTLKAIHEKFDKRANTKVRR